MRARVKVETKALLEAIEAKRAALVKKYEQEAATYDRREVEYRKALAKALRERADKIEAGGKLPENGYGKSVRITTALEAPYKPRLDTFKIDRVIRTLKMAASDTLTISGDDYAEYIG